MTKADRSSQLEHEIEVTRERLAGTIDQLIYRSSPKTIVRRQIEAIKATYVDPVTGEPNTPNILKTVGVVAGVVGLMVTLRRLSR
ncbi:hypothetical protein JCM18899A_30350 [Nocardioides sp. AN3]